MLSHPAAIEARQEKFQIGLHTTYISGFIEHLTNNSYLNIS